jgi:hypothetical protein
MAEYIHEDRTHLGLANTLAGRLPRAVLESAVGFIPCPVSADCTSVTTSRHNSSAAGRLAGLLLADGARRCST